MDTAIANTDTRDERSPSLEEQARAFDPSQMSVMHDPYPLYAYMREHCPVARSDELEGFWTFSRYSDVRESANDPTTYCSSGKITIPPMNYPMAAIPIEIDPPEHAGFRRLLMPFFSPQNMRRLDGEIRVLVTRLIDEVIGERRGDLSTLLAQPVPPTVIANLFGLPEADWPTFQSIATNYMRSSFADHDPQAHEAAGLELFGYLYKEFAARRANPRDDFMTAMIQAEVNGRRMDEMELLGLGFFVLIAGHDTTYGAIGSMLLRVIGDPAVKQRLIDEPDLIPLAIEETLRMDPPVPYLARTTTRPVEVQGVPIAAGERIALCWASANRDADAFADAETFVPDRKDNRHLTFGYGIHHCLGAPLARLELRIILEEVLRRMPEVRVDDPDAVEVYGAGPTRSVRALPVVW